MMIALAAAGMCALAGALQAQSVDSARAAMKTASGAPAGQVTLRQTGQGVVIRAELTGLPPGWHAIHIHENAACVPPFASAGGHFNPGAQHHGFTEGGPHPGDLPNIYVAADGSARAEFFNDRIALGDAQPGNALGRAIGAVRSVAGAGAHDVLGGNGTAFVVHAGVDDYATDPAGAAGDRIACGVIQRQ